MVSNREGWHYLAVKKLSALLRIITSRSACENKDFCSILMPSEDTKILEFNQYQKSDKAPFIIYSDLECILENIDGYNKNPENSSTAKISEHIPLGFSKSTISFLKSIKN